MSNGNYLETLMSQAMSDAFYLEVAPPINESWLDPQIYAVLKDGFGSRDPSTLIITCILASIFYQKRGVFALNKKRGINVVMKNPNLSRRKREKLRDLGLDKNFPFLIAAIYKSKLFTPMDVVNGFGNKISAFEVTNSLFRDVLNSQTDILSQLKEVEIYFEKSRKRIKDAKQKELEKKSQSNREAAAKTKVSNGLRTS